MAYSYLRGPASLYSDPVANFTLLNL